MRNIAEPPRLRLPLIRGLQALDRLRDRPSTATELAQSLGVNRSTAHRLLRDLEHAAYVTRDSVSKQYRLAPDKFSLSGPARSYRRRPMPPMTLTGEKLATKHCVRSEI